VGRVTKQALFKFKPFSVKQKKMLTWWMAESPVSDKDGIIADGSIRSGKTVSMSLSFVMWAMETFQDQNLAMCGKTIGSFRRNVLAILKVMLRSRGYKVKDHRADNFITVQYRGRVNYFYIFGGKDERSQDLIQGITLAGLLCDEVALMPESFVNQATGRCSVEGSRFWFNCNPDGPYHWFKQNWIDKAEEKNLIYLHFTMDDNLSLGEKIKQRYASLYSGVFFQRYILGLWVVAEGIIYDMFSTAKHIVDSFTADEFEKSYVSCDYGTQNATVFLLWQKGTDGKWYCADEYYYSGRDEAAQKTDNAYADDLEAFVGDRKIEAVVIDPSAASFIALLRERGFYIIKARNDVLDGIRFTGTQLNKGNLLFHSRCQNTIKEFGSYIWDAKACERGEDRPLKQHDHAMDAVRYFCNTILRNPAKMNRNITGGI
jgi:PBSX family phage terminase large subunit